MTSKPKIGGVTPVETPVLVIDNRINFRFELVAVGGEKFKTIFSFGEDNKGLERLVKGSFDIFIEREHGGVRGNFGFGDTSNRVGAMVVDPPTPDDPPPKGGKKGSGEKVILHLSCGDSFFLTLLACPGNQYAVVFNTKSEVVKSNRIDCRGPFRVFIAKPRDTERLIFDFDKSPGVPCMVVDPITPDDPPPKGGDDEDDSEG
ncbi:hypothetical protein [Acanthopleuribacter pedis]|uniref:Uncharacterized protein n=1 Tax=Acanthopleuribacter pedis TaxID=442870 RepID=A0A8J7U5W3_9BACT|nr:hypothetical protein [Acanthopleuribacter pedis]MBO1320893.1 hypothetical protein [Acanthopleuribacter pedis]